MYTRMMFNYLNIRCCCRQKVRAATVPPYGITQILISTLGLGDFFLCS